MKTIEERAQKYVGAPCDDGCAICDALLCKLNEYSAYIAGARSEHEELTRWHNPKEELPEPMKDVLVKCSSDTYAVDFYVPELGCFFGESATYMEVVGWREIHE